MEEEVKRLVPESGWDTAEPTDAARSDNLILDRLLDAVEEVWATVPPSEITMRRIVDVAGVSLGVAYNYVEAKDDLFGMALERMAERLSRSATSGSNGREMLESLWVAMEANPAFKNLMTWLVLEQRDASRIMDRHPVVADVREMAATRGTSDPDVTAGMLAFVAISYQTFWLLMNRTMRRDETDIDLREAVLDMFSNWFDARFDSD
jgi:AcrR family transcriptional regulator